jgi:outer membrane usher protein
VRVRKTDARERAAYRLCGALLAVLLACGPRVALGDVAAPSPAPTAAQAQPAAGQLAPIALVLAGVDRGEFLMLVGPSDILLPLDALHELPFQMPAGAVTRTIGSVQYVSLRSLAPAVTYAYDQSTLTVRVNLTSAAHVDSSQSIDLAQKKPSTNGPHADPSGFVNYSLTGTTAEKAELGGFYELGASNDRGHITATGSYDRSEFRRGLIAYSLDDQQDLRRETLGDEVAVSGALGSSVVVGGIGYSRYFALQPGFLRDASPVVSGTVLSPTQADVYINGSLYRSVTLEPGQFNLTNLPVPPGANVTQVVLRDASGATTDLSSFYYGAPSVLSRGLNEYNYHLGFLRTQPFGAHDQYGPLAGLGFYRVGLTNNVTVGGTFEKTASQVDGGPTLDLRLPVGTLNLAASFSAASGFTAEPIVSAGVAPAAPSTPSTPSTPANASGAPASNASGKATSIAYTYTSRRFSLSAYDFNRSTNYSTVTLAPNAERATAATGESMAVTLTRKLNLALSHVNTHYSDDIASSDLTALTLNVIPTQRATFQLTLQRSTGSSLNPTTRMSNAADWTIGTGIVWQLGQTGLATLDSTNADGVSSTTAQYEKLAPAGLGLGYDLQVGSGQRGSLLGSATYRSQFFDANTFLQTGSAGNTASATVAGSVDFFHQGVFFSEPVQSAYGLVHVDGLVDAPVYFDGVLVGTTGKRGDAVISNLGPYVDNQVSLGSLESLTNAVADAPEKPLNPRFYSATSATFAVHRVSIFIGTLSIAQGGKTFPPAFGSLTLDAPGGQLRSDLGDNGEFYFENLAPGTYHATALYSGGGTCAFDITVPASDELQTDLGKLTCSVH